MNPLKFSRRTLAKQLAATGALIGTPRLLAGAPPSTSVGSDADAARQEATQLSWQQIHPGVWRATLGTPEKFTPVSSRFIPPQQGGFAKLPSVGSSPSLEAYGSVTGRGCVLTLPLRPNELVYGLGLQFMSFAQRGKKKVVRVNADPKVDTGDSHAPVPFYVTTAGIGVFVDTARYATFYFGDARPKPDKPELAVTSGSVDPNDTRILQQSDSGQITIEVPHASGVDIYLFGGPTILDAVRRYNVFSGGGHIPPEWGLGFWYRVESLATAESALALAQEFRNSKIPCDVLGLEPGWQTHAYSCTFVWNKDRFPDPPAFIKSAHQLNYKVNLWEHAFTHPASPLFSAIEAHAGDYGVWGGLVPDFAGSEARRTFGDYHGQTLLDIGISGFKLDECDNSDYTGGWSFPELSRFPSGVDGEQMHSSFGLKYQQTIWQQYRDRQQPTYCLVRSSGALAAPYPFVLYSDLYNHRDFIRALVNSGFSGLLWCPEVRDASSVEDLIRRLQSVVFSPLAMVNGWYIKNPPWKQLDRKKNDANDLMENWQQIESRCREIIGWRMQLVPYLTAAFQAYEESGIPPFRPLILDYPEDPNLVEVDDTYLVGDRMLVAPMFAGEATRKVVLPVGTWHDFWTGAAVQGGKEFSLPASTRDIPVYVKANSIVPWANIAPHAGHPESRKLNVRVYGDGTLTFVMLDGEQPLKLTWDAVKGHGSVSGGAGKYSIEKWSSIG
jgi:alpha-D-xyloside xylohydrolase